MDRDYSRRYRELYERHWWWRAREDVILATLDRWKPAGGWDAILDVGCGDGLFFDALEPYGRVEGIEMDPSGIRGDGRWADRIRVAPFDETFQPLRKYALVLMLDVLEHFRDPAAALRRAVDLLEPEGTLILTVPAFPILWTSHDELNHHFARYTRKSLAELAAGARARLVESRYFFRWMAPAKLAVRVKEALTGAAPATPRIPPAWLNRLLYGLSRAEERLLGRLPAPFGASLLAVARKSPTSPAEPGA
jgi:SAM-dependent methyltransferase